MPDRVKIRTYIELFFIYCFLGWIYEVFWCNMIDHNRGFINNGFFFGPWLPIYGFGMMFILTLIFKLQIQNKWAVWGIGAALSTVAELIGSYIMQVVTGNWMWDYTDEFLNFQGRIALKPSIMFGILVLIGFLITPKIKETLEDKKWDTWWHNGIFLLISVLFCIDVVIKFRSL